MAIARFSTDALIVRRDFSVVRRTLKRIRRCDQLAPLNLFGRRNPGRMLDYLDRRACDRPEVQRPVYIVPATFDGKHVKPSETEAIFAITKDISLRGLGFTHDDPFEAEHAIALFDDISEEAVSLLLEVRWSNIEQVDHSYVTGSFYMSGGQFMGIIDSAIYL